MTIIELVVLAVVAGICGTIGQAITGVTRGGCFAAMALGFIGALLGLWIARALGLPRVFTLDLGESEFPVVWSIVGAALFVAVLSFLTRARRGPS